MNKVLIAFALREEFAPWRRRHRFLPAASAPDLLSVASVASVEAYAAVLGAGAPDAAHLARLIEQIAPACGIVTGVAAGLKPQWRTGDLVAAQSVGAPDGEASVHSDPRLVKLAVECAAKPCSTLITLPRIVRTVEEKTRLATRGDAADMESLRVMTNWTGHGIPCLALRVILDPVEMPMACDFEQAMDAHGQVRISRIIAQLARRPQLLPEFLRLAKQSGRCLAILAEFLDRFLDRLGTHAFSEPGAGVRPGQHPQ